MIDTLRQPLPLGPFNLPLIIIPLLLAWIVYQVLIKRFYRERVDWLKAVDSIMFNCLFIVFFVWKLSPLIFQFTTVIKNPAAILYLPGGISGIVLGTAVALIVAAVFIFRQKEHSAALLKSLGFNFAVLVGLVMVFGVGTGILFKGQGLQSPEAAIVQGSTAPGFELEAEDGRLYRLSDYSGQRVIVNFWASWCPPCKAELPELIAFYDELSPDEAVFLSINLYTSEREPSELPAFIEEEGLTFPVLYDVSGKVSEAYAVKSIPTTVVIGRDGTITSVRNGAVTKAWLYNKIQ